MNTLLERRQQHLFDEAEQSNNHREAQIRGRLMRAGIRGMELETHCKICRELIEERGPIGLSRLADLVGLMEITVERFIGVLRRLGVVRFDQERRGYVLQSTGE